MYLRFRTILAALIAAVAMSGPVYGAVGEACESVGRQPATQELEAMVNADAELRDSLLRSIELGQRINSDPATNPVASIEDYYDFVDALVTYNPQNIDTRTYKGRIRVSMDGDRFCNWNILDLLAYSYFLVDRQISTDPRGQIQFENEKFGQWMRTLAQAWGDYLETPASAVHVPDFTSDPEFGDWYCPESPYSTYQEFFVRELCKTTFPFGSRPVEGYHDDRTVVSIGDSTSAGWWAISDSGKLITTYDGVSQGGQLIKGKLYSDVHEFINGADDEHVLEEFGELDPALFDGGIWTHQFLNVINYHRLHVPVSGKIIYLKHLQSGVRMKSAWKAKQSADDTAYYDPRDTADWQFGQTRMVIGIETEDYGVVVISPMGMAQVSGIRKRDWVQEGAYAYKGWEFANFLFGGSDFVVIFQNEADFVLTVPEEKKVPPGAGVNYMPSLQGEKYGCFGGDAGCMDEPTKNLSSPPPDVSPGKGT